MIAMTTRKVDNDLADGQGHWWSQLSVNQVATPQAAPPLKELSRKKRSRGNRKEQHCRRRLRRRELKEATKTWLLEASSEQSNKENHTADEQIQV